MSEIKQIDQETFTQLKNETNSEFNQIRRELFLLHTENQNLKQQNKCYITMDEFVIGITVIVGIGTYISKYYL